MVLMLVLGTRAAHQLFVLPAEVPHLSLRVLVTEHLDAFVRLLQLSQLLLESLI